MKPKRERRPSLFVEHDGRKLSLAQWAKETGLSYETLLSRYKKGVRGDELFGPSTRGPKRTERTLAELREDLKQSDVETREQAAEHKSKALRKTRDQVLAEHAAEFSRPLIDAKLFKPKEREAIRERVRFSGQLSWRTNGTTL